MKRRVRVLRFARTPLRRGVGRSRSLGRGCGERWHPAGDEEGCSRITCAGPRMNVLVRGWVERAGQQPAAYAVRKARKSWTLTWASLFRSQRGSPAAKAERKARKSARLADP